MRARSSFYAATAATALAFSLPTLAAAETVETVPAKKVEASKQIVLANVADAAEAKPTVVKQAPATAAAEKKAEAKVAAVTIAKPKPRPVAPSLRASINLSSQTMTVKVHGKTKHVWKISSGRRGYYTPNGTWRPQWMTRMHYSRKYDNAPMPHSVFFYKGYAIHATYATGALGRPASHGCIRLSPSNAKKFYNLVGKHGKARTRISVTGSTPKRTYAKRKKKQRKTYSASSYYTGYSAYKPAKKVRRKPKKAKYYKPRKKKAYKPSYSYYAPKKQLTWPGDR